MMQPGQDWCGDDRPRSLDGAEEKYSRVQGAATLNRLVRLPRSAPFPPQLVRHPPPPRTRLMTSNSNSAPMVALMIAEIMPEPRLEAELRKEPLPMKAPSHDIQQ